MKFECEEFKNARFAKSTQNTHRIQLSAYEDFLRLFRLPMSSKTDHICLYITYLARRLSFSSIRQYVSALHGMLLDAGLAGVDYDSDEYKACLAGIKRTLGMAVVQAPPLLPTHLCRMFQNLSLSKDNVAVRAAILVCFRGLLRQNQITGPVGALTRRDFRFSSSGLEILVRTSKTIQFREKVLVVPIVPLKKLELCPVYWIQRHFREIPAKDSDQAFRLSYGAGSVPLTYPVFLSTMRLWAKRGGISGQLSTHSLRRGGATFFRNCGASIFQIEARGDWVSNSVFRYLDVSLREKWLLDRQIAKVLDSN